MFRPCSVADFLPFSTQAAGEEVLLGALKLVRIAENNIGLKI